ncbi:unnamed protein product, partial [Closterium sp. NIES-64]
EWIVGRGGDGGDSEKGWGDRDKRWRRKWCRWGEGWGHERERGGGGERKGGEFGWLAVKRTEQGEWVHLLCAQASFLKLNICFPTTIPLDPSSSLQVLFPDCAVLGRRPLPPYSSAAAASATPHLHTHARRVLPPQSSPLIPPSPALSYPPSLISRYPLFPTPRFPDSLFPHPNLLAARSAPRQAAPCNASHVCAPLLSPLHSPATSTATSQSPPVCTPIPPPYTATATATTRSTAPTTAAVSPAPPPTACPTAAVSFVDHEDQKRRCVGVAEGEGGDDDRVGRVMVGGAGRTGVWIGTKLAGRASRGV